MEKNEEFWRDHIMDKLIENIIEIFNLKEVELVRLNGLTKYLNKIKTISKEQVEIIIIKLKKAGIINYQYIYICPYCKEKSYIIIPKEKNNVKTCDTCKTMYQLQINKTLFK